MLVKKWIVKDEPPADFDKLFADWPPLIRKLLYNRGLRNQKQVEYFFNPDYGQLHDPFLFRDMRKAIDRILMALDKGEKIVVHGDYDADGVTSSAIIYNTLKLLDADIGAFIPHREEDGYGLNKKNIQKFIDQGVKLIITVDCGSTNVEEVKLAQDNGVDVIITDHHNVPEVLPEAFALLNPRVAEETYPFEGLSGVGMAYKLVSALLRNYPGDIAVFEEWGGVEGYLKWVLDIVAIGLVADIMPLIDENRTLVNYGLLVLSKTRRLGLNKLAEVANIDMDNADSFTIGYQIAPRINAAGRLSHGREAFKLLTTDDESEAEDLAWQLNEINGLRRKVTDEALVVAKEQAELQKDNPMLFVFGEGWQPGVVGLIAGRICEAYHKPTLAMTTVNDNVVGSGRSIPGFNVTDSLYAGQEYLARFGGHPQACGFTVADPGNREAFQEKVLQYAVDTLEEADLTPLVEIEAQLTLAEADLRIAKQLQKFRPFGQGNPRPQFLIKGVQITALDFMGDSGKHLRLMIKETHRPIVRKLVGFNIGQTWGEMLRVGDLIDVIVEMGVNVWKGRESVELKIVDLRTVKADEKIKEPVIGPSY